RKHHHIVKAAFDPILTQAKCLPQQALKPVAHHRAATRLTYGQTKTRTIAIVLGCENRQQTVTDADLPSQNGPELAIAQKTLALGKRKPLQYSTTQTLESYGLTCNFAELRDSNH
ncbi:MAG TPA: hypothetical protein VJJ98_13080, partial [Sedimentisphaerales bacterium]|nr:hypothetical protein [Sedimentisphaerales bacterium]